MTLIPQINNIGKLFFAPTNFICPTNITNYFSVKCFHLMNRPTIAAKIADHELG